MARDEQDVEVFGHRVPVDVDFSGDVGDGHAFGVVFEYGFYLCEFLLVAVHDRLSVGVYLCISLLPVDIAMQRTKSIYNK